VCVSLCMCVSLSVCVITLGLFVCESVLCVWVDIEHVCVCVCVCMCVFTYTRYPLYYNSMESEHFLSVVSTLDLKKTHSVEHTRSQENTFCSEHLLYA